MKTANVDKNRRVLVIDDNRAIHEDFRKILGGGRVEDGALDDAEALLFDGGTGASPKRLSFEIDSAFQGAEGLALVKLALEQERPYAMAFVDVRMPPGWDGVETTARMWEVCPDLQIVICTAYSDYSWDEMSAKLNSSDQLVILKKPFDTVEVLQLANALTEKWRLHQQVKVKLDQLEGLVHERTKVLQKTNDQLQTEITERKRAAEALRESEERYELLFRKNPLPMWVVDSETLAFLAVNETAVGDYGYSAAEFRAMTLKDLQPPNETGFMDRVASHIKLDAVFLTTRHRRKDGSIIDVEIIARNILFDGRKARLALANNVTERKAAETRIREQATLLNLAQDGILVRDLSGGVHYWNKGAERMFGWTAAEAVGAQLSQLFAHDETAPLEAAEQELLANGEWSGDLRHHTKDGRELLVSSRWTLLRGEQGQPLSVLIINTDVTEKKKLEAQFLRAQRMEGIGTLATGMAHDLNNILAPILMSAGTLRWDLPPHDCETAISRIEMSVKRGAEIIQQVLTFGRGVTGERVAVNAAELTEEVVKIIDQTFPKNIEITCDSGSGLWPIIGDKTQIHQVLLNLCINGRDAMAKGGHLALRVRNLEFKESLPAVNGLVIPGPYVALEVSDSGCGIAPRDLDRIFDPFFTTKEFGKGTGLGLATVLGIVKSHHGFVIVETVVNQGTTFRVLLPASREGVCAQPRNGSDAMPRGNGESILVVDDEKNITAVNTKMLERYGYRVIIADNGNQALERFKLEGQRVDLVVTDIMMPGMDGLTLIQELRRLDPQVKIVACSGLDKTLGDPSQSGTLASLGVRSFLAKPFSAQRLLLVLRDLLASKENGQSLQEGQPAQSSANGKG